MGLSARARKLIVARGISEDRRRLPPRGLAWSSMDVEVDREALRPGERVVVDFWILSRSWPEYPDEVSERERVARAPGDRGGVYAWNGTLIGFPIYGRKDGCLLDFVWPEGLPARDPSRVDDVAAGA